MQWSGNATIGFNADGMLFENHHISGISGNSVACKSSPWTNIIYQLCKLM